MKFSIESGLKELKWDKKKIKLIDGDMKKRLLMMEDLILNLHTRTNEVFKHCQNKNTNFQYILPTLSEKDQHFEAYQKNLLLLEGIYQFIDYVALSKSNEENLEGELAQAKNELASALKKIDSITSEADLVKKRCKEYLKQAQNVHEKCNFKTIHYKETLRENKELLIKNKDLEKKLKDLVKKNEEILKDLNASKAAVREKTIEINLLEKINIEQSMDDENLKEKLFKAEDQINSFKVHDEDLHNHVVSCENPQDCRFKRSDLPFKYEASKNLIKRMQGTIKKKNVEISKQKGQVTALNNKIVDLEKNCNCLQIQVMDTDGILEENRRLWDGYIDLQMDQVSMEKDMEILERNHQNIKEELRRIKKERDNLEEDIKLKRKIIGELQDRESSELLHLRSFLDEQKDILQDKELKFISLENEYLQAQDLLEEYKKSFEKFEELLDNKSLEHEEKITNLSEELNKFKTENNLLIDILGNPFVNTVVEVFIKMEELEECIDAMMNIINHRITGDDENELNNNSDYPEDNLKHHLYEDLKCKIGDLRLKCTNRIERVIHNVDDKLEKYKMILFSEDDVKKEETFIPKTYENIKMQLSLVNT